MVKRRGLFSNVIFRLAINTSITWVEQDQGWSLKTKTDLVYNDKTVTKHFLGQSQILLFGQIETVNFKTETKTPLN